MIIPPTFIETFKAVKETYKNIDIVVNTAGVIDGKNWEREIVTDLVSRMPFHIFS